jgi:porin
MAKRARLFRGRMSPGRIRAALLNMLLGAALIAADGTATAQSLPERLANTDAISGNPAATTFSTGTGLLGHLLGLRDEWGVRLGGIWLADTNLLVAGGAQPGGWTNNSALFISLAVDAEKLVDWRGAAFGFQFLQVNGANTNGEAGSIPGYNGIVGAPPFQRTELFEAWYEQRLIEDVLKIRVGRSTPAADFNNVLRPITLKEPDQNISSLSGVLYSTVFVNGSLLGALPGYYNPGDGITVNFTPTTNFYLNAGVYDGNLARGIQTGLNPPQFNGYYFAISEIGVDWLLGEGHHPGQFAIGLWRQTGLLGTRSGITQDGTGGFYLFGSQRVAHGFNEQVPSSSLSFFYQFGVNDSQTLPINQYYGGGITAFGVIGDRARDSMGVGMGLSRLNPNLFARPSELMLQAYYQAHLFAATFLQPTITYIPTPGASATTPSALTLTMRLTLLF